MTSPSARTITILVGTDHHPFGRLVDWADAWARSHPDDTVFVQYGDSPRPVVAQGQDFLPPTEVGQRCAVADVVITHGGPGTIMEARGAGHRPLVVARDPQRGEHVDEHQQRFTAWAAGKGLVRPVDPADLDSVIEKLGEDGTREPAGGAHDTRESADRLESLLAARPGGPRRLPTAVDATTVVYIGGWGRSGSTLLECLVSRLEGVVVLGEVTHLWERGLRRDELCACGRPFSSCDFWQQVGERAFGGWQHVDVDRVLALKHDVDRQRHMPRTSRRHTAPELRRQLLDYSEHYRRVYDAAAEVSGADVVVDSSKEVPTALALSHNRRVDLRVMHIVRDSRGVAYSWSKVVARPETADGEAMPQFRPAWSTTMWLSLNAAVTGLRYRGVPVTRLRYEDLVADAAGTVRGAWQALGLPGSGELPMLDAHTVELMPTHSVAGNPMRFRTGRTELRHDTAWQTEMSPADRRLVTWMSYPMLRRLGYRGRPR